MSIAGYSIFDGHLETNYLDVKTEYTNLFLSGYQPLEDKNNDIFFRTGSDEERKFISTIAEQVEGLIIPSTFELQLELNKQEETQNLTSMITTRYKNNEILTATEATALAIYDTTQSNQNDLEQHIKKLINDAISKKLTSTTTTSTDPSSSTSPSSSPHPNKKKQKNSQGSKRPLPLLPKNERGEKKGKVFFRYPINKSDKEKQTQPEKDAKNQAKSHHHSKNKKNKKQRNGRPEEENQEVKNDK
jgi:hypothetical protein